MKSHFEVYADVTTEKTTWTLYRQFKGKVPKQGVFECYRIMDQANGEFLLEGFENLEDALAEVIRRSPDNPRRKAEIKLLP